ncbi:MAG: hypothetical protein MK212_04670 [Saprospiraceae bacterium]|nr:hypothetical protein [Saprospiraceae bacterium]
MTNLHKCILLILSLFSSLNLLAQSNNKIGLELDLGAVAGQGEVFYYGANTRVNASFRQWENHYPTIGIGVQIYANFTGEIDAQTQLQDDVDMRIIPALYLGYGIRFSKFNLKLEIPVGVTFAITKGKLINEKIGFERSFSHSTVLPHVGGAFHLQYQLHPKHRIGLFGFYPFTKDMAWSVPLGGLYWSYLLKS